MSGVSRALPPKAICVEELLAGADPEDQSAAVVHVEAEPPPFHVITWARATSGKITKDAIPANPAARLRKSRSFIDGARVSYTAPSDSQIVGEV
jgi:hypothetical protein